MAKCDNNVCYSIVKQLKIDDVNNLKYRKIIIKEL